MDSIFKALSDPTRRQILKLLREAPLSAGDIAGHFEVSKPTISGHLAVLREADLVDVDRHGNVLMYRLKLSVLEETMIPFMDYFSRRPPAKKKEKK